ncbi:MAG: hypothetical protein IKM00_09520 [Clostridia bacterium]|nr:hypothetical protein [Clostridia bacterium]MBR6745437.1 hypothetical protein [Clostridia bacterium]
MKYYDARIIEGCCVFSYEVKTPNRSSKNGEKRKRSSASALKKALLRFFLFLLIPFAFVIDSVVWVVQKVTEKVRAFLNGYIRGYVFVTCLISSVSLTALVPLLLYLL